MIKLKINIFFKNKINKIKSTYTKLQNPRSSSLAKQIQKESFLICINADALGISSNLLAINFILKLFLTI